MSRILSKSGQYQLLSKWLMYLSIPILFVVTTTKWKVTGKISTVLKMLMLFTAVPSVMTYFSTSPGIYATSTGTMMMLIGVYSAVWLFATLFREDDVKDALDPETSSFKMLILHTIGIVITAIVAVSYISSGNALLNGSKLD